MRDKPQVSIWSMRIACWIPKVTNIHSGYVIFIAFPLQKWLHERALMLCYTYIANIVIYIYIYSTHYLLIYVYTVQDGLT